MNALYEYFVLLRPEGYQGRSPWLVGALITDSENLVRNIWFRKNGSGKGVQKDGQERCRNKQDRPSDGKIVCNGVVITANCVAPLSGPIRSDSHPARRWNQ